MREPDAQTRAENEQKQTEAKTEGLRKFLDQPLVRMGMSSLGATSNKDSFALLLSAAFEAGFQCGAGTLASDLLRALVGSMLEKNRQDEAGDGQ